MIIEQLTFRLPPDLRPRFLACDAEIWTPTLAAQPGYLGKDYWAEVEAPEQLHLIIRWQTHAHWKAVPADLLAATDRRFEAALGQKVPVLRCLAQEVINP